MLNSCVIVARADNPGLRGVLQRRFDALSRFYAPISSGKEASRSCRVLDGGNVLLGEIAFGDVPNGDGDPLVWGEPLPGGSRFSSARLLAASDRDLRALEGVFAIVAADQDRARLISGTGLTSLFAAGKGATRAWSTHAVAAAWMGTGVARVDSRSLPELMALEFVGDDRTLIEGATAVPSATCIDVDRTGVEESSYWKPNERWEPIPEEEAQGRAESALLSSLSRRLDDCRSPFIGLTGGYDSPVVAVAMQELGIAFQTFTWGEPQWPDAVTAADVARHLGLAHRVQPPEYLDDEEALACVEADVRWSEGVLPVSFVRPTWPSGITRFVTGTGAETGRAAYLVYFVRPRSADPEADTQTVAQGLSRWVDGRLRDAGSEIRRTLCRRIEDWVLEADRLGYSGWRSLDVVYAEQRVRRWARAYLQRADFATMPSFTNPDVLRALACLPLLERVSSGFTREFLRKRRPSLVPPPTQYPNLTNGGLRQKVPPRVRHLGARVLRRPRSQSEWLLFEEWKSRPIFHEWIADEVLAWPPLEAAIGRRWLRNVRSGFLRDDRSATNTALLAAAPVALSSVLGELVEDKAEGQPLTSVGSVARPATLN